MRKHLEQLWNKFSSWEIPIHSFLAARGEDILWEAYRPPYQADTLHRMFSITKSFSALAVGHLIGEGKLALDDPIIRFFPEYLTAGKEPHPYLAEMTVRDLLTMRTCYDGTTYKHNPDKHWVESFFTTPPTHKSGQIFMYDTSASHTLAALVKKLSGLGVIDYLRTRFLDEIGFSKEAYIIPDPFGTEMGGSGLMARPKDMLLTGQYLLGEIHRGTGSFAGYLREAVSFITPTRHCCQAIDEYQGYGYQFWQIRGGFAMYGMGGQYVLFYPDHDLVMVITADSQHIKGGTQKILDAVYETLFPDRPHPLFPEAQPAAFITDHACRLLPNPGGFSTLAFTQTLNGGTLTLSAPEAVFELPFGRNGRLETAVLAKYQQPIASSGYWLDETSLFIHTQITGECVGSLGFMVRFREDGITLWMNKVEETLFREFSGFIEGRR